MTRRVIGGGVIYNYYYLKLLPFVPELHCKTFPIRTLTNLWLFSSEHRTCSNCGNRRSLTYSNYYYDMYKYIIQLESGQDNCWKIMCKFVNSLNGDIQYNKSLDSSCDC